MAAIRLYLDEDINPLLAKVLRSRGFDVVSVHDLGRTGLSDVEQFQFARSEGRVLLTCNIGDFVQLATILMRSGEPFPGLVTSEQLPFREFLRRTSRLMQERSQEDVANTIVWLSAFG